MVCTERLAVALQFLWLGLGSALIHHLEIKKDQRSLFKVETFCFEAGGNMDVSVRDFTARGRDGKPTPGVRAGFLMVKTTSESQLQQMLEESVEDNACILDGSIFQAAASGLAVDLSAPTTSAGTPATNTLALLPRSASQHRVVNDGDQGLYSLVFARCFEAGPSGVDASGVSVEFALDAAFWNEGPNYLSACEAALPKLFAGFAVAFLGAGVAWVWTLRRAKPTDVHHIHTLMAVLVFFKAFALLFDSIRFHFLAATGAAEGWAVVFYVVTFCKSLLLFTVILLIGTGWSLVKPFLNAREKQVVAVVLALQVLDNVALVVLDEMAPGSRSWYTWRDVLHLVDIACCCAVLFPIVWSIRHLRQAAAADGKAEHTLHKLTLFRTFYIVVVAYIYFTRIVVYLVAASVPYDWVWTQFLFRELASLAFYGFTGFKFQPRDENPYLPVRKEGENDDDEQASEYGLEDDDGGDGGGNHSSVELAPKSRAGV